MRPSWATAKRFLRNGMEPILVLAVIAVLRGFGLAGDVPLWLFVPFIALGSVLRQPQVQLRLSGGDLSRRIWPRIALQLLSTTVVMYLTGWGALLAVAHLQVLSIHLRQSGSRAWRPAAVWSVLAIGLGQVAYSTGILHSNLALRETYGAAVLIALGTVTTARTLGQAVAQRERAEHEMRRNEERFRALVRDGSEVIMECLADGTVTYVSPAALTVMGYQPDQLHGAVVGSLIHPADRPAAETLYIRVLSSDASTEHTAELRFRHADGEWRWHEVTMRNLLAGPEVHAIIGHHRDITERRVVQDRIAYAATHDDLTGLANAPMLQRDLDRSLAQGTRYQHAVGMLFLDLDGFKQVNDTYGHAVGDRLLQAISEVIRGVVRDTDSVGRIGGDEFGVVLSRVAGADEALAVAARIVRGIDTQSSVAGLRFDVGCSIGVAIAFPGGSDAKTLQRHADTAMYDSKRRGRNGVQLYVEDPVTAPWLI